MWRSHLHAQPTNAPLFYGDFAADPELFTPELLNGFDAWLGPGTLLSTPALHEGELSRHVYLPRASPRDRALYFDLHSPYGAHTAGSWVTISTPIEHIGLFAREGSIVPIGKPQATVTQVSGPGRTHTDGVDVLLESEGGVVGLDDWRGVQIFPSEEGQYVGEWIEDDGISYDPAKSIIEVTYTANKDEVKVSAKWKEHGFKPLWRNTLHVILPMKDQRKIKGAEMSKWGDRVAWIVNVQ